MRLFTPGKKTLSEQLVTKNLGRTANNQSKDGAARHTAWDALRVTGVNANEVFKEVGLYDLPSAISDELAVEAQYSGYLKKQEEEAAKHRKSEDVTLSSTLDWTAVHGLSAEIQGRLAKTQPRTLGEASRLPGITPVALSAILVHLKKRGSNGGNLS